MDDIENGKTLKPTPLAERRPRHPLPDLKKKAPTVSNGWLLALQVGHTSYLTETRRFSFND